MQMCVSLGEESPGTVVEKHMGLGHPNVHLRETIRHKSSSIPAEYFLSVCLFVCFFKSKLKTTDRQAEGEDSFSISNHCMTATGQVRLYNHHRTLNKIHSFILLLSVLHDNNNKDIGSSNAVRQEESRLNKRKFECKVSPSETQTYVSETQLNHFKLCLRGFITALYSCGKTLKCAS